MLKSKMNNKGITLIALIITIILLLILAGVTISTLTGDNGLLTEAGKAKKQSQEAQEREQLRLAILAIQMEEATKTLTEEQKRQMLEQELQKYNPESTVTISDGALVVNYGDEKYEVNQSYEVSKIGVRIDI